jgi:Kef-type K+ transport system membrane component KefB
MFTTPTMLSSLSGLSVVGVVMFGLISGLHLDPGVFSGGERTFWPVAAASIAAPIVLGCFAGYWILARHPDELLPGISAVEFELAIGICVTMNALPVLGAILGEMGLLGSRIGNIALGVAGVNNIVLWLMLGILLTAAAAGRSSEHHGLVPPIYLLVLAPAYIFLMIRVARPVLSKMIVKRMQDQVVHARALVVVGGATIASALVTELMGLHYIIGAFLVGAIMPANLHKPILDCLQVMTVALLMPFFFATTGMRLLIDTSSPALLEVFVLTSTVAVVGIVGGTAIAARWNGETWPFAFGLGSLLQSKGLTELIVLTILLDAQIISPRIFSAVTLMALFSITLTMPLARLALAKVGQRPLRAEPLAAPSERM